MWGTWYLNQNSDVKKMKLNPLIHFLKYGRLEGRTWFMPIWFMLALGWRGWVWRENKEFFTKLNGVKTLTYSYFSQIEVLRLGKYDTKNLIDRFRKE
jgi:hypothetical protein